MNAEKNLKKLMKDYVLAILKKRIKMKSEKVEILNIELLGRILDIELRKVKGISEKELYELLD